MAGIRVNGVEIRLVPVPVLESLDEPGGWMYQGMHQVARDCSMYLLGEADAAVTAEEAWWEATYEDDFQIRNVIAVAGGNSAENVVGWGMTWVPTQSNPDLSTNGVRVRPDWRRRGIGTQLADWVEAAAKAQGRTSWITYAMFAEVSPGTPTVSAAEGDEMPADSPGLVFAQARGYTLRQIMRRSRLNLPVSSDLLDRLEVEARSHTAGYRYHQWPGVPPDEWLDKLAKLGTDMSTDQPLGELSLAEEVWTGDRIRSYIVKADAKGMDSLTTAAEFVETGELVAMTQILVSRTRICAEQDDTIVRRDHRGHRLGLAIKIQNLRLLAQHHPRISRIYTFNASENQHMLAINTALGFYPYSGSGVLQQGDR